MSKDIGADITVSYNGKTATGKIVGYIVDVKGKGLITRYYGPYDQFGGDAIEYVKTTPLGERLSIAEMVEHAGGRRRTRRTKKSRKN